VEDKAMATALPISCLGFYFLEGCGVAQMHRRSVVRDTMPYAGVPYSPIGPPSDPLVENGGVTYPTSK
jgi:hypothetical protein